MTREDREEVAKPLTFAKVDIAQCWHGRGWPPRVEWLPSPRRGGRTRRWSDAGTETAAGARGPTGKEPGHPKKLPWQGEANHDRRGHHRVCRRPGPLHAADNGWT